ncbi:MAG: GNAT family N-acetyltransferase [Lacinutrix sp.]|uniref:GNAT family N-acetyltransferase n=1 Tax=Lacinutrix sp. TaxID=1937692 RepID=UPI0030ADB905
MLNIVRTNSEHQDFIALTKVLDRYLKVADGNEHDFYNQFNNLDALKHTIVVYKNNITFGCGAFKGFEKDTIEIKRMFTLHEFRGKGIAFKVLTTLENWAIELGFKYSVLETGTRQKEAVAFYKKCEYNIIANYGQYKNMENSLCFKKMLFLSK